MSTFFQAGRLQFLAIVFISVVCVSPLIAQNGRLALLVQKIPEYGGVVTPTQSVQLAASDQLITITATPRDGYEFVYWLGDVTAPTSSITTVLVDAPKMVIAVFERPQIGEFSETIPGSFSRGSKGYAKASFRSSRPNSNPIASPSPVFSPRNKATFVNQIIINEPPEESDDPEKPEVPEPATIVMLGSGLIILLRKRK